MGGPRNVDQCKIDPSLFERYDIEQIKYSAEQMMSDSSVEQMYLNDVHGADASAAGVSKEEFVAALVDYAQNPDKYVSLHDQYQESLIAQSNPQNQGQGTSVLGGLSTGRVGAVNVETPEMDSWRDFVGHAINQAKVITGDDLGEGKITFHISREQDGSLGNVTVEAGHGIRHGDEVVAGLRDYVLGLSQTSLDKMDIAPLESHEKDVLYGH